MTVRVVHVITGLGVGGAERALFTLLGALSKAERSHCSVVSLTSMSVYGPLMEQIGVRVTALGMRSHPASWGAVFRLRSLLSRESPDVVVSWMYHANIMVSLLKLASPAIPVIIWNIRHSLYALSDEKAMTRWVIRAHRCFRRGIRAIVYNSELSKRQHTQFGISAGRPLVIPNGFDLSHWRPDPDMGADLRRKLGIPDEARVIGHVARYHPLKDQVTLLLAMATVLKNQPNAHCVLIGRHLDSGNAELGSCFESLPAERVHTLGERFDVDELMRMFDVFCLSSRSEAFPNVLGEAMASGVVCVSTDAGDARNILGESGRIVPIGDVAAMAAAIEDVLDMDDVELSRASNAAREEIGRRFGIASTVMAYRDLLEAE